ncbi:hypothetical protein ADILRU_0571 [Leifsonia rubra CMS 76R]|nr:hypothetical protein ADILRU_0571 [Leifsonia rubra CMS 76R]
MPQTQRLGLDFKPVLFDAHRKPVGATISVALLDQLESLLEYLEVRLRTRT